MDLLSVILTLRPIHGGSAQERPTIPFWWGRAAQTMFLSTLAHEDEALAARLHDDQGPHPYTISTLLGKFPNGQLNFNGTYTLRLTAFEANLAEKMLDLLKPGGPFSPGAKVELDHLGFFVESSVWQEGEHPWAGSGNYAKLAAMLLSGAEPPSRRIDLHWASPVAFRSKGNDVPLPMPDLVFGSLLDRWNAYSPIAFPSETRRYAAECLGVTRYQLKTRSVLIKEGVYRVGASGEVSFTTFNYDRYWMGVLNVLAAFAFYSGVGVGASHGMGQCRQVER